QHLLTPSAARPTRENQRVGHPVHLSSDEIGRPGQPPEPNFTSVKPPDTIIPNSHLSKTAKGGAADLLVAQQRQRWASPLFVRECVNQANDHGNHSSRDDCAPYRR
ncbi:MAG: hypothetical protein WBZ11_05935, partial [Candidatus Sulfotelmatobacter sp.]